MTIENEIALRTAAEACSPSKCADAAEESRRLNDFYSECTPELVLEMLDELHRLRAGVSQEQRQASRTDRTKLWRQFGELSSNVNELRNTLQAENDVLHAGMNRVLNATRLGDKAFAIVCEVMGELNAEHSMRGAHDGTKEATHG